MHQTVIYPCTFKNLLLVDLYFIDKKIKRIKIQHSRRLIDWSQRTFALFRTACQWQEWRKPFECLQVRESTDIQRNQSQSGSDEWGEKKNHSFVCVFSHNADVYKPLTAPKTVNKLCEWWMHYECHQSINQEMNFGSISLCRWKINWKITMWNKLRKKQQLAQQFRKGETDTFSTTAIFQKELIEFISGWLLHDKNMQNKANIINSLQKSNKSIWWLSLEQEIQKLHCASKLCCLLPAVNHSFYQMENNLKNTLKGNNISLMKNVLHCGPNHQTKRSHPRFILVKRRLVKTLHQNTRAAI